MVFKRRKRAKRMVRETLNKKVRKAVREIAYSTLETKHHRTSDKDVSIPDFGGVTELNTIDTQGDTSGTFIGQEVRQIGLRIKGQFSQGDSSNVVRYLICTLKPPFEQELNNQTATPSNIFYDPTIALYSPMIESKVSKVFVDRLAVLNMANGQNDKIALFNHWIDLKMKKYYFQEDSNTQPKAGSQVVYFMVFSDSGISPHPSVTYHSTLYYKDG